MREAERGVNDSKTHVRSAMRAGPSITRPPCAPAYGSTSADWKIPGRMHADTSLQVATHTLEQNGRMQKAKFVSAAESLSNATEHQSKPTQSQPNTEQLPMRKNETKMDRKSDIRRRASITQQEETLKLSINMTKNTYQNLRDAITDKVHVAQEVRQEVSRVPSQRRNVTSSLNRHKRARHTIFNSVQQHGNNKQENSENKRGVFAPMGWINTRPAEKRSIYAVKYINAAKHLHSVYKEGLA